MHRSIHRARLSNYWRGCCAAIATALTVTLSACGSGEQAAPPPPPAPAAAPAPTTITEAEALLVGKPWLGDLDGMAERRVVRMLVIYNKTNYFFDKAQQRGLTYDMGMELEKWLNRGNKDRTRPIRVVFIPTSRDRLLTDLAQGRGDIAAAGLAITPERQQVVSFTVPFANDVSEMLITSAEAAVPDTVDALSGRSVYVRRSSSYYSSLEALNARLQAAGKPPVIIELADENLEDEDILEMVNAGLIETTVVDSYLARFWEQVFPNLRLHPELVLRSNSEIAWAMRKDAPKLKATLDEFVAKNQAGTAMGNMILRKYLQTTKWARNATAAADMKRFEELSKYFKKYATQ